jgi:hypothetical protein
MDTNKSQIHDRSLSWLGTGTSIKYCAVKLVLCGIVAYNQVSILSVCHAENKSHFDEMMMSALN